MFDECHKAKNLVPSGAGKPSKTGLTVLEMQKKLPKARVVYCSATGENTVLEDLDYRQSCGNRKEGKWVCLGTSPM